jgi:fermentation-respiration switch protein FrsA (DUF1100 family)
MKRMIATFVAVVVVPYLVLVAAAWLFQRRLIFLPFGEVPSPAAVGLSNVEPVVLHTEDGLELHGWLVAAAEPGSGITVIHFNGNGGNRAHRAPFAAALARRGVATLLFDYRGYGENPGSPSEDGLARDARAVRAFATGRPDIARGRIVYYGESLGTAVALQLALDEPPHALVLRSPFTSLVDVAASVYPFLPVRWLLGEQFAAAARVGELRCPVLVIVGGADRIIPVGLSERVYRAAPQPKRLVRFDGADHNDYELIAADELIDAVVEFLR